MVPQQAYANIQALRTDLPRLYGPDGFFDAVDPTTGAVGHRYLVLDQSMIMAALDNALNDRAIQRDFARDPVLGGARLPAAGVVHARRSSGGGRGQHGPFGMKGKTHMRTRGVPTGPCRSRRLGQRIGRRGVPGQGEHHGAAAGLARPAGCGRWPARGTSRWTGVRCPERPADLVYRATGEPSQPLDHGGGDVLAVPAAPYADTSGEPGRIRHYAVAAVLDGASAGPLSEPVAAAPLAAGGGRAAVTIEIGGPESGELGSTQAMGSGRLGRPWEPMIGSEHLSYMLSQDLTGGRVIGPEVREALRIAHEELGVRAVRAHAILCDDVGCTPKRTAARCTTSPASTGCTTSSWRSACGRSSSCPSCPATWPATRARRCSATARSSRRPRTGIAGPTWSGIWPTT